MAPLRFFALVIMSSFSFFACAQSADGDVLRQIIGQHPEHFDSVLAKKEYYRLQIIYTQVDRDENNQPHLNSYALDTGKCFYYCASMIKLLEIPLAMEKINRVKNFPVSIYDSIVISGDACGDQNEAAYRKRGNFSTPAQLIKEMLLVSNNHAFNPLYDFLGQHYFNDRAHQLGYGSAVVCNRFAGCDTFQNRIGSAVIFYDRTNSKLKYLQENSFNRDQPKVTGMNTVVGKGFLNGPNVDPPKDFCYNNYISLGDLHRLVINLTFPQLQQVKMDMAPADYSFIHKYMGMYPRESVAPVYDVTQYPDNKMKFFLSLVDSFHASKNVRVFNKVGLAYGFVTDCSYFVDTLNKVEFFLSCSMYVNRDEILNDGIYEYELTAFPFFRNLCTHIYNRERARPRKYLPVFEPWDFTDSVF
ncbi:MAG: hypothetical protein JWO06_2391 [Bacteroidota bacterium]|nr:hypothetical protein [Bacteroidota bacterium]